MHYIVHLPMSEEIRIREDYTLARCCAPRPPDEITGYYSHDGILKVHRQDCPSLNKAEQERLVKLSWDDVLDTAPEFTPGSDFDHLDAEDFAVLKHHREYGVDYSHVVARKLHLGKKEAFERHRKLRSMGLLERVEPVMIQYRKGVVDNKWIKHRNHTYYQLTKKGNAYLDYYTRELNGR